MTTSPSILVAGVGNIFLGDDAFGVHVAQMLMQRTLPPEVRVVDLGIRGLDLVYALMEPRLATILVDAAPRGHAPGTLYVIEPEPPEASNHMSEIGLMEGHSMDPEKVLRLVHAMGGSAGRVLVVGCEPAPIDPEADISSDLSPAVAAALEPAAQMVESLIAELLRNPVPMEVQHAHGNIQSAV